MDAIIANLVSDAEIAFTTNGISEDFRNDGRSCFEFREINIKTGNILNCNGSARINCANCDIIVGVKLEIDKPLDDEPDLGRVEFTVECSANANPLFEGRGGDEIAQEIVFALSDAITPSIDRKALCINSKETAWIVNIDVLILECGSISSLIDLSAMGVKAALHNTRIPKLILDEEDASEFIVSDDTHDCLEIDVRPIPLLLTLTRIHDQYVADVTEDEAASGIARLTIALDDTGNLSYIKKAGSGSLHPDPLKEVLSKAKELASSIHRDLYKKLNQI